MRMLIREFAALTGVSVRTLHYYDEIGLLHPAETDGGTGYRYYDERSLQRMQEILFYRELDFPLRRIQQILESPGYDRDGAVREQRRLLLLKKERLERIIAALDEHERGANVMKAFDNSQYEKRRAQYEREAREKWGGTDAYAEYERRQKARGGAGYGDMLAGMESIFEKFSLCMQRGEQPGADAAQALVRELQDYITMNFYTCTDEVLAGLGSMYTADERFTANIDRHGAGTAEYAGEAIAIYCGARS